MYFFSQNYVTQNSWYTEHTARRHFAATLCSKYCLLKLRLWCKQYEFSADTLDQYLNYFVAVEIDLEN